MAKPAATMNSVPRPERDPAAGGVLLALDAGALSVVAGLEAGLLATGVAGRANAASGVAVEGPTATGEPLTSGSGADGATATSAGAESL